MDTLQHPSNHLAGDIRAHFRDETRDSSDSIVVRAARSDDAGALEALMSSRHLFDGTMRIPNTPVTGPWLGAERGTYVLVATDGDDVVGVLVFCTYPDWPRHRHVGEVDLVVTHIDHRGRGVASKLMSEIIDMAEQWMALRRLQLIVFCDNVGAIRVYERLGFQIEGTMRAYGFGRGQDRDAYIMARLSRPGSTS